MNDYDRVNELMIRKEISYCCQQLKQIWNRTKYMQHELRVHNYNLWCKSVYNYLDYIVTGDSTINKMRPFYTLCPSCGFYYQCKVAQTVMDLLFVKVHRDPFNIIIAYTGCLCLFCNKRRLILHFIFSSLLLFVFYVVS